MKQKNSGNSIRGNNNNIGDNNTIYAIDEHKIADCIYEKNAPTMRKAKIRGFIKNDRYAKSFGTKYLNEFSVDFEINDQCPLCRAYGSMEFIIAFPSANVSKSYIALFQCKKCGCIFSVLYKNMVFEETMCATYERGIPLITGDVAYSPIKMPQPELPKQFTSDYFLKFRRAYEDLCDAKAYYIEGLMGIAYRRAIECLIKDWLIANDKNNAEKISQAPLGALISGVTEKSELKPIIENTVLQQDSNIKYLADKANILANDFTHYKNEHPDVETGSLQALFDYLVGAIQEEIIKKENQDIVKKRR